MDLPELDDDLPDYLWKEWVDVHLALADTDPPVPVLAALKDDVVAAVAAGKTQRRLRAVQTDQLDAPALALDVDLEAADHSFDLDLP
jgi:hypothetical protein